MLKGKQPKLRPHVKENYILFQEPKIYQNLFKISKI